MNAYVFRITLSITDVETGKVLPSVERRIIATGKDAEDALQTFVANESTDKYKLYLLWHSTDVEIPAESGQYKFF